MVGTRLAHYDIVAHLGSGGMGEVYRAHDTLLNRDVALKILPDAVAQDADRLTRFEREAQALAALNHPHIAQIYGLEQQTDTRALVMELVEGETLAERIARAPLPMDEAIAVATGIAEALESAHDRGIVHRDLKPANIKLTPAGDVKVLDFGLAKLSATDAASGTGALEHSPTLLSPTVTAHGLILGTAAYMSPEQARGKPVDRRADLWAFGCVLYEMLTGASPFAGETITDILGAVVRAEPDWTKLPKDTPANVARVLRRCLRKDVKQRIGHANAILIDLQDSSDLPARAPGSAQRRYTPWIAAAVVLTAMAGAGAVLLRIGPAPPSPIAIPVIRADVALPDVELAEQFALSPDGRAVAFVTRSRNGLRVLAIRELQSNETRLFETTGSASAPFWSPDGTGLGFLVGSQIRLLNVTTGDVSQLAATLSGVPPVARVAWGTDNTLLVGGNDGILAVGTDGSHPRLVAQKREDESFHRDPQFLTDDRFIFTAVSADRRTNRVYVSAMNDEARHLIPDAAGSAGFALGHLFYERDGRLYGQPVDLTRPTEPRPSVLIADTVYRDVRSLRVAVSVSPSGVLLYRNDISSTLSTRIIDVDRDGKVRRVVASGYRVSNVTIAPDGSRVAYNVNDGERLNVWTSHVERGTRLQLSAGTSLDHDPVWSPDGLSIAYASERPTDYAIQRQSSGGGGRQELLVTSEALVYPNSWSPDGRFLAYTRFDPHTSRDLWLYSFTDRSSRPLAKNAGTDDRAEFSPDGKWLAYDSGRSGRAEVYVRALDGSERDWRVTTTGAFEPHWRGDGRELFYIDSASNVLFAVEVNATALGLEFGAPRRLFEMALGEVNRARYAVYDQGRRFIVATIDPAAAATPARLIVNWPQLFAPR